MSKNFYITTAIPYVNGTPHIGHALDYLLADVCFRYEKESEHNVKFQAGTDEHGNKIQEKAILANIPVEEYVTNNSNIFKSFIKKLGVTPTDFIRTTDENHIKRCQEIWKLLKPFIYSSTYEGWYCTGCERFITEKEYEDNKGVCPDHNKPYTHLSEKNYYLKISAFKGRIKKALEDGSLTILPDFRKKEIINLLEDSPDVSISRPKKNLAWGIPVPDDDSQVMYVWIDALANYITILGFPEKDISDFWPADVQIVGKDVLRFHAIIWPSMLFALNLPLPKTILCHGHVLADGQKMSKSIGNVIDPNDIIEKYGLDPFRYYFLRHVDTFADSDFTWDKFNSAYADELANDLGNLVQRISVLDNKNSVSLDKKTITDSRNFIKKDKLYKDLMNNYNYSKAFDYIWEKVQSLNKEIDEKKPWALAKTDPESAKSCLVSLTTELLSVASLLSPFLPETSKKIRSIFEPTPIVPPQSPLFPKY